MKKATTKPQQQLRLEFKEVKKEVKVISLVRIQNNDINSRILNRTRPTFK